MAKKSMIAREVKRIKTVEKYAEKRATLKKAMNDQSLSSEERYEARIKFQKLPRNYQKEYLMLKLVSVPEQQKSINVFYMLLSIF